MGDATLATEQLQRPLLKEQPRPTSHKPLIDYDRQSKKFTFKAPEKSAKPPIFWKMLQKFTDEAINHDSSNNLVVNNATQIASMANVINEREELKMSAIFTKVFAAQQDVSSLRYASEPPVYSKFLRPIWDALTAGAKESQYPQFSHDFYMLTTGEYSDNILSEEERDGLKAVIKTDEAGAIVKKLAEGKLDPRLKIVLNAIFQAYAQQP